MSHLAIAPGVTRGTRRQRRTALRPQHTHAAPLPFTRQPWVVGPPKTRRCCRLPPAVTPSQTRTPKTRDVLQKPQNPRFASNSTVYNSRMTKLGHCGAWDIVGSFASRRSVYISLFSFENSHYLCTGTTDQAEITRNHLRRFVPTALRGGRASRVGRHAGVALLPSPNHALAYEPYFKSRVELCRRWRAAFCRENACRPECALWRAVATF